MYCTLTDIEAPQDDLIELTDDSGSGVIDEVVVDKAIANATEQIDGYLRGRYTLPLSPVSGLIGTICADLALYRLYARRPRLSVPESLSERYKNAVKLLENIQKGVITLGATGTSTEPAASSTGPSFNAPERLFSRESLKDY
jgi:phage gp36-like protein